MLHAFIQMLLLDAAIWVACAVISDLGRHGASPTQTSATGCPEAGSARPLEAVWLLPFGRTRRDAGWTRFNLGLKRALLSKHSLVTLSSKMANIVLLNVLQPINR